MPLLRIKLTQIGIELNMVWLLQAKWGEGDARWSAGAAVFFAWIKDPAPRVRVDDPRIQVQDYALFRTTIPLNRGEDE